MELGTAAGDRNLCRPDLVGPAFWINAFAGPVIQLPAGNPLSQNAGSVVTSEIGYLPRQFPELREAEHNDIGEFLHELDEHDGVHHVWAAVKKFIM